MGILENLNIIYNFLTSIFDKKKIAYFYLPSYINLFFLKLKDMAAGVTAKNFIAFGGGSRTCTGAEFSRVLMAVFFHVLVTNYRYLLSLLNLI